MAPKSAKQPTDRVTVRIPVSLIQQMQALVDAGMYRNTTDVVYNAVKALLMAKGGEAKVTIEAQKGLLQIQEELAKIAETKRQLGLS